MGVSFIGQSSATDNNVDTGAVNKPAGTLDQDVMVLFIIGKEPSGQPSNVSPPGGWNYLWASDDGIGPYYALYYKVALSEPSSYTITTTTFHDYYGFMVRTYRGEPALAPTDVNGVQTNAASTSITAPSVSATKLNDMVVAFFYQTGTTGTITPPAGFGNSSGTISIANQINFLSCDKLITATGATGTFVATSTLSAANLGAVILIPPLVPVRTTPGRMQALQRSTY